MTHDVVIVGGGAAGLSAGLVLARARRQVVVIDAGGPRNAPAAQVHGYLSRDGLAPAELLDSGRAEVQRYGGELLETVVTGANRVDGSLRLTTQGGHVISARRLLVTTGLADQLPAVGGLGDRWGRDVLHCPYCHGWEVRDRRLAVLGDGTAESIRYAQVVRQWSADLTYLVPAGAVTDRDRVGLAARGIVIVEANASQVDVDSQDRLVGVATREGQVVACDAVFVQPRLVPNAVLLRSLGCKTTDEGWPVVTGQGRTSVPEVWAAGNVTNARAQVITAAGEGSAAAIAINVDLVEEDVRLAVRLHAAPTLAI
jgi:thioredoxin reductase